MLLAVLSTWYPLLTLRFKVKTKICGPYSFKSLHFALGTCNRHFTLKRRHVRSTLTPPGAIAKIFAENGWSSLSSIVGSHG